MAKKRLMREGDTYWDPDTGYIYNLQGEIIARDAVYRPVEKPRINFEDYDIKEEYNPEEYTYKGPTYVYADNKTPTVDNFYTPDSTWLDSITSISSEPIEGKNKFEYLSWSFREFDLPTRATKGSAGYDFHSPKDVIIQPGETVEFSLEVKVRVKLGQFLMIVPRSSLGFKGNNHVALTNTTGIIDSDYYNNPDNEGEIKVKLHNFGSDVFVINKNDKIVQGIFVNFDVTDDDEVNKERLGGLGSTGN